MKKAVVPGSESEMPQLPEQMLEERTERLQEGGCWSGDAVLGQSTH